MFYAKKPEMRIFWLFILLALSVVIVQSIYLPGVLSWLVVGVLILIAVVFFSSTFNLAKSNFAVKLEHEQLLGIFRSLQDGVIAYDPNFNIEVFNVAAEKMFNIKSDEILNTVFTPNKSSDPRFKLLSQVIFPSLAPIVIPRSLASDWPQIVDISFSDPLLEVRVTTAKILDPRGKLLGFMKIIQDRTREVSVAKSKSEFVTVAAHQLRTPLSAVSWTFQTLDTDKGIPENLKQIIHNGKLATDKLLKTVNDLLDVSKIEDGRFGYSMIKTNLIKFIEDVLSVKMGVAQVYGIKMYFDKPKDDIEVKIDIKKMTLVLDNLLENAIKYNVKNGEIIVAVEKIKDKPFVQVSVKDTGVGIPANQINKLFDKFFRADNVIKYQTEGTGLGLYIVKNILRQHGGEVWAESVINRGSIFYFTLPIDDNLIPIKEVFMGE